MRRISVQWSFLLIGGIWASLLQAQQPAVATMEFRDNLGNLWLRKQTTTIERHPLAPIDLFPQGDFNMPRLKPLSLKYQTIPAGDTIQVSIVNKTGAPFKSIRLTLGADAQLPMLDSAVFQYQTVLPYAAAPSLKLRAKPSLRTQTANIRLQRTPPARYDTLVTYKDSLLQAKKIPGDYFTARESILLPDGSVLDTSWNGNIPGNKPGEIIHRIKKLNIRPNAPNRTLLQPNGIVRLRNGKTIIRTYSDFAKGDTLIFMVEAFKKTALKRVSLIDKDSIVLHRQIDLSAPFLDTVVVQQASPLSLALEAKFALRKKYAKISVWRIRPIAADTFYTVIDSTFLIQETIRYDTLVLTLFDDSLQIAPIWNIEQAPYAEFKVQISTKSPKIGQLAFVVYWLGIGQASKDAFNNLDIQVPPEWSRPGVSAFLGAIGFRHLLALTEPNDPAVLSVFTNLKGRNHFKAAQSLKKSDSRLPIAVGANYGLLNYSALSKGGDHHFDSKTGTETLTFYSCFQNKSTVNTYPIAFKMVGFYLLNKTVTKNSQWLKTEMSKEPLRKKETLQK